MFNQLFAAIAYTCCYEQHRKLCTGRPLNKRDFATMMGGIGFSRFIQAYWA